MKMGGVASVDQEMIRGRGIIRCIEEAAVFTPLPPEVNVNTNNQYGRFGGNGGPIGMMVSGVATGIRLASESIHHYKEKKATTERASVEQSHPPPAYSQSNSSETLQKSEKADGSGEFEECEKEICEEGDEEQWDLDDAQDHLPAYSVESGPKQRHMDHPSKVNQNFLKDYPVQAGQVFEKLALPVVLPQRRPKDRSRGFIRAYAPDLMSCGIDQAMFLDFLETFNLASQANPWINAINLAGFAFMALPTGISQAAALALMMAVKVVSNMNSRSRYNSFLDKINDEFYRPRGLYCMVLTWNPDSPGFEVGVNATAVDSMIASNIQAPEGIAQKTVHKLRPSMGNTAGVAFMETAPLVFPKLDELNARSQSCTEEKSTKEKLKSATGFVGDYFDRRAQAAYAADNPDSGLNVGPKPKFTSRLADPNNPAHHGSLLALLSGGRWSLPRRGFGGGLGGRYGGGLGDRGYGYGGRRGIVEARREMFAARNRPVGDPMVTSGEFKYPNQQYQNQQGRGYGGPGGLGPLMLADGVKRILSGHVLYLLIVNMPSQAEMAEAEAFIVQQGHAQG